MGVAPELARRILWRLLDGRDPVAIAAELLCGYRDVAAVQASIDMVELACTADGSRVVIEARDDAEAVAVKRLARASEGFGGPKVKVEGPGAVRFARQAPVAPAAPQHIGEAQSGEASSSSQAKPEEAVSASTAAASVAATVEDRAARPARGDKRALADDAGSRASGGAGPTALTASAAGSYNPAGGAAIGAGHPSGSDRPPRVGGGDVPGSSPSIASIPRTARGAEWTSLYRGRRYDLGGLTPAQVQWRRRRRPA